jgi:hypothetical protein
VNITHTFVAVAVAVAAVLPGAASASATAPQRSRNTVVKVFVKGDGRALADVVTNLGRDWAKKKESIELVRGESDADLVVTLGSRRRGRDTALTITARFGTRTEKLGGDDLGWLIPPASGGALLLSQRAGVAPDRLGGDDLGWLVGKADGWLNENRTRVLQARR